MDILEELKNLGLTDGESRVYVSLIKLKKAYISEILMMSKVSSAKVYDILDRLEKKGLISTILSGKKKSYLALPPNRILDYLEDQENLLLKKKDRIKEILPNIEDLKLKEISEGSIEIYEGYSGFKTFMENIKLEKDNFFWVIGAGIPLSKYVLGFMKDWQEKRAKSQMAYRAIYTNEFKENIPIISSLSNTWCRILEKNIVFPSQIYITKNFIVNAVYEPNIKIILIYGERLVESYKNYFEIIWEQSK